MLSSLGFTSPPNKMAKKDGSEDSIGVFVIISVTTLITNNLNIKRGDEI